MLDSFVVNIEKIFGKLTATNRELVQFLLAIPT
jgi:hypothetical protein